MTFHLPFFNWNKNQFKRLCILCIISRYHITDKILPYRLLLQNHGRHIATKNMAQTNDDGVLPNSVITRENSIQSHISMISKEVEENVGGNFSAICTRPNSIQSSISTISLQVEEGVGVDASSLSIKRNFENKDLPIDLSSPRISNVSLEGKIKFISKRSWRARALLNIGKDRNFVESTCLFFF